jgi:hypothetical protein
MNSYEDDLRNTLKAEFDSGDLRDIGDATGVFELLSKAYPVIGSRIDWDQVPDSIEKTGEEPLQLERFADFFDQMCSKFGLDGAILYAGDSATDFALESCSIEVIRRALPHLIEIPQHHYFIGPRYSWCMCLTMEGDMAFGFTPF